jgi:hypothetical protein
MEIIHNKTKNDINVKLNPIIDFYDQTADELCTTGYYLPIKKENKSFKENLKKYGKMFFKFFCFKLLFKVARNLDKSSTNSIGFYKLLDITFDPSNLKFAIFVVLIKALFRFFRKIMSLIKLKDVCEYKRLNFVFGLLSNLIIIPLGKKSTITFYVMIYYLLKNLIYFLRDHLYYYYDKRLYKESKHMYFVGAGAGFILFTLLNSEYRKSIKIIN